MLTLSLLSFLLFGYAGVRLVPALDPWPVAQVVVGLLLVACAINVPAMVAMLRRRRLERATGAKAPISPPSSPSTSWPMAAGFVMIGFASSMLVLTFLRDVALVAVQVAGWLLPPATASAHGIGAISPGIATTLREASALAVPLLAAGASLLGWHGARRTAGVRTVDVPIANLPPALEGFTIAQISDVHVGNTIGRDYVAAIVERVNALGADVVAITGDLVDGTVAELADGVAPLVKLRSRHGSFFVTGNHEYYSGATPWIDALRGLGINVLQNQHVVIEHAGARLVLAGVTDYSAGHFDPAQRSDPVAALRGAPADAAPRILLAHQPRSSVAAASAGFDLQISGHTHGGQFLPWKYFVRWQQPFTAGLHRIGAMWIYTSRGTGYWGPPMRLGAPSEITRLRLTREPPTPARRGPRS